jgi:3'(2'), 5'-bisphosphate nucleotidase
MTDLRDEILVASSAARAAGTAILGLYGNAPAESKADASPVTAADYASNDLILSHVRESFPADAILSEESADSAARLTSQRVWVVDPLDGTREFIDQNGEFSVMIGLAIDGRACLGVVYQPTADLLYGAVAGHGAWVEDRHGRRRLDRVAGRSGAAVRMVGSRSHAHPLVERLRAVMGIGDVAPSGSVGVKCARIAEGEFDLYVHPVHYLKEWDVCAPEIILREAGGTVTDCLGEPLVYNKPDPRHPHGIFACAPGLFDQVMGAWLPIYQESRTAG